MICTAYGSYYCNLSILSMSIVELIAQQREVLSWTSAETVSFFFFWFSSWKYINTNMQMQPNYQFGGKMPIFCFCLFLFSFIQACNIGLGLFRKTYAERYLDFSYLFDGFSIYTYTIFIYILEGIYSTLGLLSRMFVWEIYSFCCLQKENIQISQIDSFPFF